CDVRKSILISIDGVLIIEIVEPRDRLRPIPCPDFSGQIQIYFTPTGCKDIGCESGSTVRIPGDNIDQSPNGFAAVQGGGWTLDYFDPVNQGLRDAVQSIDGC